MKKIFVFCALFLIVLIVSGCVKDDSPYPIIDNTSWKRVSDENWERLSFSNGRVHYESFKNGSLSEYDSDYTQDSEVGCHFYAWIIEDMNIAFRVYSAGHDHIIVGYHNPLLNSKTPWYGMVYNNLLFDRE